MLNFSMTSLTNKLPNNLNGPIISQDNKLHIVNWPHDILRLIGRLLPKKDAIYFTNTCVLLFTLRYKAGGHGIFYAQCWKRLPVPREAIYSMLNLENRTTVMWSEVRNYAPAISTLTLNFPRSLSQHELASVIADLKDLATLTTLNIGCLRLPEKLIVVLLLTVCKFNKLRSLTINSACLTRLPAELARLQGLQILTIDAAHLKILPSALLRELQSLQSLTINASNLTILPAELGQLQHLQNLTISTHRLTTLPAELGQLQRLQNLKIYMLKLTTLSSDWRQFQSLQSLTIYAPSLTNLNST